MTTFARKFNKSRKFNVDTTNFEYRTLTNLYNENGADKVYPLTAIYINTKSQYGDNPVLATDDCFVNVPSHMLDTIKEILQDDEAIEMINDGKVGFSIYKYEMSIYKKTCFGVNFHDVK